MSTNVLAQNNRFGLKSGVAISNIIGQESQIDNNSIDWETDVQYQTGIFYNVRIPESKLSFQTEVDYKKIGTGFPANNLFTGNKSHINYEFEYAGISILPRIDLLAEERLNPNFMFGIIMDYRLDSELIISSTSGNDTTVTQNGFVGGDINHQTNKFLFGYIMAGGIEIYTKPVIITLETRYTSFVTPTLRKKVENLEFNSTNFPIKLLEDSRNQYYSFLIGFNFYF